MISEGDEVIMYANFKQMYRLVVKSGDQFQSKFGSVRHIDMIGKRYGTKIYGSKGYSWNSLHFFMALQKYWHYPVNLMKSSYL